MSNLPCDNQLHGWAPNDHQHHWLDDTDPANQVYRVCGSSPCPNRALSIPSFITLNGGTILAPTSWFPDPPATAPQVPQTGTISLADLTQALSQSFSSVQLPAPQVHAAVPAPAAAASAGRSFPRPSFSGEPGTLSAHAFSNAFAMWTSTQGTLFYDANHAPVHHALIRGFLLALTGKAASWASPYMAEMNRYTFDSKNYPDPPFLGNFETCLNEFIKRFVGADDKIIATQELQALHQGKGSIHDYSAKFVEISSRTGLSPTDLMIRFRSNLNAETRYLLAISTLGRQVTTLAELRAITEEAVLHMKATTASTGGHLPHASTASPTPALSDPNAMEIDAARTSSSNATPGPNGKTFNDWRQALKGRCITCGLDTHMRRQCPHANANCDYCTRSGHLQNVCQRRFLGHPRGAPAGRAPQRAAATGAPFSLFSESVDVAAVSFASSSSNPSF